MLPWLIRPLPVPHRFLKSCWFSAPHRCSKPAHRSLPIQKSWHIFRFGFSTIITIRVRRTTRRKEVGIYLFVRKNNLAVKPLAPVSAGNIDVFGKRYLLFLTKPVRGRGKKICEIVGRRADTSNAHRPTSVNNYGSLCRSLFLSICLSLSFHYYFFKNCHSSREGLEANSHQNLLVKKSLGSLVGPTNDDIWMRLASRLAAATATSAITPIGRSCQDETRIATQSITRSLA